MNEISERELSEAVAATKKDAKLVAAAKNDRMNSAETMYREFEKLTQDRRREIIIQICNDYFVAALWKIAFPLNNFPANALPDAVQVAGKALFFAREEDSVRESIRAIKIYQDTPYMKQIAGILSETAEIAGPQLGKVAKILTEPEMFAIIKSLDSAAPASEQILRATGRVAGYTRDFDSTLESARFLHARRYSTKLPELIRILEESIFMARDRRSVRQIMEGLTAGGIDVVLQKVGHDRAAVGAIRDIAWRSRNARIIRDALAAL